MKLHEAKENDIVSHDGTVYLVGEDNQVSVYVGFLGKSYPTKDDEVSFIKHQEAQDVTKK